MNAPDGEVNSVAPSPVPAVPATSLGWQVPLAATALGCWMAFLVWLSFFNSPL
ncbi:hypothetical protein Pla108_10640 [Botrimarina colliarenosi]|uniref:Uncharacterized protein n=1 Tax=Botrimarina colliarenosi TaxID=2528001 RepID=A0A5C6AKE4_9BACT|nr:hypothetical protein Pla108_10640 [Botrimarina colliarenosi]